MSNIQLTVDQINQMEPLEIVDNPIVRDRFIQIYDTLWGAGTGEAAYQRESVIFNRLLRDTENGKLQTATRFSIFTAFIDLAVIGLSLEPGSRALCYLMGRNVNAGTKDRPQWEGRCVLTVSGYGELVLRTRAGQIRYADNPVLVYDNDEFSFADRNGRKSVEYVAHLPHTGHKVIACYLGITRADGSRDYGVLFEEDWQRLKDYSLKNNQRRNARGEVYGSANALYSSGDDGAIDPGFLCAKCIKHAFKSYPKVRIGRNTELQSEQPLVADNADEDYYGVADPGQTPAMPKPDTFCPEPDTSAGVTVATDPEDAF